MRISLQSDPATGPTGEGEARLLGEQLRELGFDVREEGVVEARPEGVVRLALAELPGGPETLLERALRALPLDFDSLPLLVEGESKIIRQWTSGVVVMRFKPTVYSYTSNRYGEVPGTDALRVRFASEVFRGMARYTAADGFKLQSAFLAEREDAGGWLMVQRLIAPCNLELRIKRYHIGSPIHRYRFTERHPTVQGEPLRRWARFDTPLVCFDWRHPLRDEQGQRLADEPLPDDYAAVWIQDVARAKRLARESFLWLEEQFARAQVRLIDMCVFIDSTGSVLYGEISPDCMRVRLGLGDPSLEQAADKDLWRTGKAPDELLRRYTDLYHRLKFPRLEVSHD